MTQVVLGGVLNGAPWKTANGEPRVPPIRRANGVKMVMLFEEIKFLCMSRVEAEKVPTT
jgi:hypothetical protein